MLAHGDIETEISLQNIKLENTELTFESKT